MTYDKPKIVKMGGVTCLSDLGLYYDTSCVNYIKILSVYGSTQEVKAIFSGLVSRKGVSVPGVGDLEMSYLDTFRLKLTSIGYGKKHGLIRSERVGESTIFWLSPEEKFSALTVALSKRKIPFSPELVPEIEKLLLREGYFEELKGWGGIEGYECSWNDDLICNLIGSEILAKMERKNGTKTVSREVRREIGFQA